MELFFQQSWWLPQIVAMICVAAVIILLTYFITKTLRAKFESKMPANTMLAIIKEGDHMIAYVHKDASLSMPDVAAALTSHQLEHKEQV